MVVRNIADDVARVNVFCAGAQLFIVKVIDNRAVLHSFSSLFMWRQVLTAGKVGRERRTAEWLERTGVQHQ